LDGLCAEDYRLKIRSVSLEVCSGEVIGLAGMEGSGQGLFLRSIAGLVRPTGGKVILHHKDLTSSSYHTYKNNGAAFLPASRLEEGLVSGLNLTEHFVLSEPQKGFFVDWDHSQKLAQKRIADFNIRGLPSSRVEALSGGNQQRALLAMMRDPLNLLLLEHPTRGLDIESTIYIWSKLKERCRGGTAVVFISSDLEEILQYSDRVLVFFSGRVSAPLDTAGLTSEKLGQLIGGKGWPETGAGKHQ
jgi:simple sugar transport system ATP-binding protein